MSAVKYTWTSRQGREYTEHHSSRDSALARLAYLEGQEEATKRLMPTDSGDVRFNYNEQARALRAVL